MCVCVCLGVWLRVCCVCVCVRERERELTPSTPHETLRGKYIIHRAGVMDNLVTLCSTYMLCVVDRDSLW